MTDIDENLAPTPTPDVDPASMGIEPTPEEYFILSRVDGNMTIDQICKTCGLGRKKTMECIENLRDHGLIRLPDDTSSTPANESSTPSQSSAHTDDAKQSSTADNSEPDNTSQKSETESQDIGRRIRNRFPADDDFEFDQELLAQSVELDEDFKEELCFVFAHLDTVNHYELLGVEPDAERRDFRSNYFRMSKRYHPDRFYQKILGDYGKIIEKIFQRVTNAYQTLSNRTKRKEYDATLEAGRSTHATPTLASTPAARRSEPREEMKGDRKRDMAFKVLVQRGDKAFEKGLVATALKEYRKALTLNRNLDLALRVAQALLDDNEYLDDAASFARAAQKISPDSVEALKLLGQIYELKNEPDDALYHYEQALQACPDDAALQEHVSRLTD